MDALIIILIIAVVILLGLAAYILFAGDRSVLNKFLIEKKVKVSRKQRKVLLSFDPNDQKRLMYVIEKCRDYMKEVEGDPLDNYILLMKVDNVDSFNSCYKMIHQVDSAFLFKNLHAICMVIEGKNDVVVEDPENKDEKVKKMVKIVQGEKVKNKNTLEAFSRSWCDQVNANLAIEYDTAFEYIKSNRDFSNFVNLDLMAKRAEIEIDEKRLINDVRDEDGLTVIIYSLIRAKYEGIFLSEEDSLRINKANVLEYNDSFKITQRLLMELYNLKRDVNRFTNVMIRAHNSGIRINFSITDLYSLTDDEFDILVTNIIRASDSGINIDQKDLIRQNIQGNDISDLITGLIKANQSNIDVTPDELMNYFVNTRANVVKFVEALAFIKKNKLDATKDYLVSISKPNIDLLDFVKALKLAKEYEGRDDNYGITVDAVKSHFSKHGEVHEAVKTVIKCREELGLLMNFGIAGKILEGEEYDLKSAIAWAQNPQVMEVEPCVTCVCKNGVQITPKVNITVRGKMEQIFWGYKLDVLFKRINEAIISEFSSAESHETILQTLPQMSQNVLNRINEEENRKEIKTSEFSESDLNDHCSYNLLDVNIYDVVIGQNIKAELELRQAQINSEMRKLKAEADRAKAEADIRIAMVQQYKEGIKPNFNELHKANLLAEISQDINTGYDNPE